MYFRIRICTQAFQILVSIQRQRVSVGTGCLFGAGPIRSPRRGREVADPRTWSTLTKGNRAPLLRPERHRCDDRAVNPVAYMAQATQLLPEQPSGSFSRTTPPVKIALKQSAVVVGTRAIRVAQIDIETSPPVVVGVVERSP